MRKIISILIIVCMFFTSATSIFAISETSNSPFSPLFSKMEDETYISNIVASDECRSDFVVSNIEEKRCANEKDVLCAYSFTVTMPEESGTTKNLTENWIVKEKSNGYEYTITDGIKTNVIYVDSDQNVYLDGSPVMIEYYEEDSLNANSEISSTVNSVQMNLSGDNVQTRGLYLVQSTPRKGNASDYTAGKATTYPILATSTKIKEITQSALFSLVIKFVSPSGFIWQKIGIASVKIALKWMVDNGYGSLTKMYLKETKWRHKDSTSNGYYSGMTIWKVKHYFITPSKSNICSETWYHNWQ